MGKPRRKNLVRLGSPSLRLALIPPEGKQQLTALSHVSERRTLNSRKRQCRQARRSAAHSSGGRKREDERREERQEEEILTTYTMNDVNPPVTFGENPLLLLLLLLNLSGHTEKLDPAHSPAPGASWEPGLGSGLSGSCSAMVLSLHTPLTSLPAIFLGVLSISSVGMLPLRK
ncbi:hypothetical protein EYF80_016302 [Liparis tanakae]|uniref:Uncharacterized protein n=1 Tax=Liparis tanakae TaxID=230148 RepID=A0A4Z2I855_9TELE|nr:hypothetical protein EYF80_016302 [Liparis tanakae]